MPCWLYYIRHYMPCQAVFEVFMKIFSTRLVELRKAKKLKQTDIAKLLDVTPRHYQKIEYGQIDLPSSKLVALADYFDVSLDYLVGRSDNPDSHKL